MRAPARYEIMQTDTVVPHMIADYVSERAKNEGHAHKGEYNNTVSPETRRVFGQSLISLLFP